MKKIYLLVFSIFFIIFPGRVFSAEKTSEEYYQQFLNKYRIYQSQLESYNIAKSRYLSYQSLTSKVEYLDSAKPFLFSEIEAEIEYVNLLRARLVEATNVLNYQENLYFVKLDDEISQLSVAKNKINNISSISDLLALWKEVESHFEAIDRYGYAIKSYIKVGSLVKTLDNFLIIKNDLKFYLTTTSTESAYLAAGKENFARSENIFQEAQTLADQASQQQVNFGDKPDYAGTASTIKYLVDKSLGKIQEVITNYINITNTLIERK